jgi:predicted nuclease of predicted toxin-antitoxin system
MRFLIDAQLPPSLAEWLREKGIEAQHVYDVLPANAEDEAIWTLAVREGYVLITKDEDFAEWSRLRNPTAQVLWLRIGNVKRNQLQARLEPLLQGLLQRLGAGETLIEVQ